MYRVLTLLLPVPHDELYDYIVAGAAGPEHHLLAHTDRQRSHRVSARRAVPDILGAAYRIEGLEPPHRIDLALEHRHCIAAMILAVPAGPAATTLTLYLWAAPAPLRPVRAALQRRHIRRIVERAQRLPAVVAHPSWPGAWPG